MKHIKHDIITNAFDEPLHASTVSMCDCVWRLFIRWMASADSISRHLLPFRHFLGRKKAPRPSLLQLLPPTSMKTESYSVWRSLDYAGIHFNQRVTLWQFHLSTATVVWHSLNDDGLMAVSLILYFIINFINSFVFALLTLHVSLQSCLFERH